MDRSSRTKSGHESARIQWCHRLIVASEEGNGGGSQRMTSRWCGTEKQIVAHEAF